MTKFLNISVDNTLGGNSPSDVAVSSQKAVKEYVDACSSVLDDKLDDKMNVKSFLVPNFDGLTPIATYEYDIVSSAYMKFLTVTNNYTKNMDIPRAVALFRITVTGTNIYSVADVIIEMQQRAGYPLTLINYNSEGLTSTTTGIRYIRTICPRALNNGYDWEWEHAHYGSIRRHYKIEVFKSDSIFNWLGTPTASTYNTTYQASASIVLYTTTGIIGYPALGIPVVSSSTSTYATSRVLKNFSNLIAGQNILDAQLAFLGNNSLYPASETNIEVNPDYGFFYSISSVNSGSAVSYASACQKINITSLTNIPHATIAQGDTCYMRCTMDANGKIYSDNYVTTSMSAGYTWYYVGVAASATSISFDATNSVFITLDNNGKLTHVNGKEIVPSGSLPSQTGQAGKFLTTDGSSASWETVTATATIDNLSITENSSQELQTVGVIDSNNTTNAIKTWTGTKAQYDAIVTKDANTEYLCTDTGEMYLGTVKIGGSSSRNIGEIIQSTIPLSDAGLHLLDGALISGAGSYAKFVTYIAGLVSNYPDLFIAETAWQQAVTDYGVCGKFVYDSTNNTVRLPKITGFTEGTTDVTALGDLIEAGLPNITNTGTPVTYIGTGGTAQLSSGTTTIISQSNINSIYGNSTTVQPQAIKVLYYIVIANSVKTNIEVDIDEVMTDLNTKQDVSNLVTSVSSLSTDIQYPSAKLFYDTCGDIETLINAL